MQVAANGAVEPIDIREDGKAIDRVNMYASFWKAEKTA